MKSLTKAVNALTLLVALTLPLSALDVSTPEDKILSKGFQAYMDGNDKRALSYFEEVLRINPKNGAARTGLDKVKVRLRKKEDVERAKAKNLAEAKYREGKRLLSTGDTVAAIDAFHDALDAVPTHKPSKARLASIKKQMDKVAKRRELNLTNWAFARGTVAYLDRDWAKAWRIWNERLQLEPGNIPLANATKRAENNFRTMMAAEKEDFFRRSARAFYEQGLYAQAVDSWKSVLEIRQDDQEGMEGKVRSEEALLRAQGKGRDTEVQDLLAQALDDYASQRYERALDSFNKLALLAPEMGAVDDYRVIINRRMADRPAYVPASVQVSNFRPNRPSNVGERVDTPKPLENFTESRKELEAQVNRNPSDLRIKEKLDKVVKQQEDESERIYKDGLIAYSQGNRPLAIQYWKQVLVINPNHKKAQAALTKARAEEEREAGDGDAR